MLPKLFLFLALLQLGRLQTETTTNQELQRLIGELGDDIEALEDEVDELGDEVEDGMERLRDEVDEVEDTIEDGIENLRDDVEEVGDDVEDVAEDVDELGDGVDEVKSSTLTVISLLNTLKEELAALRKDTSTAVQDLASLKRDTNSSLSALKLELQEDLASLRQDTNSSLQDLKMDLANLREDTEDIKTDLASLSSREDTLPDIQEDLASLREDTKDDLKDIKANVQNTLKNTTDELTILQEQTHVRLDTIESKLNENQPCTSVTDSEAAVKIEQILEEIRSTKNISRQMEENIQEIDIDVSYLQVTLENATKSLKESQQTREDINCNAALVSFRNYTNSSMLELKKELQVLQNQLNTSAEDLMRSQYSIQDQLSASEIKLSQIKDNVSYLQMMFENDTENLQESMDNVQESLRNTMASVQYLPTSCSEKTELDPHSPSGYYQIRDTNGTMILTYCYKTSPQHPAPSCEQIAEYHSSGYYWVRSSNGSAVNVYCDNHLTSSQRPLSSCQYIATNYPSTPSGYYWVRSFNRSAVNVYCDNHLTSSPRPLSSCQYIATHYPSTPSGYYWVRSFNRSAVNVYCDNHLTSSQRPLSSCQYIATHYPSTPSGYHWVRSFNGSAVNVYCDMTRHCCNSMGGWIRVAYLDMTDTSQQCPEGFRLITEPKRTCGLTKGFGCTSITFSAHHIQYNKVCGRVRAYQHGPLIAFYRYYHYSNTIENIYVDGVSITHGTPRQHIWTFAGATDETRSDHYDQYVCPCTKTDTPYTEHVPPYIGNDYFCDTGSRERFEWGRFYSEDPLWDGEGCGPTSSCCQFNSPPWFCKELSQATTDDIEFRLCKHSDNRDIPIELIEVYIQ